MAFFSLMLGQVASSAAVWPFFRAERGGVTRVLELGAGVGFASLALLKGCGYGGNGSKHKIRILTTDKEPRALVLAALNAARHGVARRQKFEVFDFTDDKQVERLCPESYEFDLVMGAALQFDDAALWPPGRLWDVLARCVAPGGVVLLAHTAAVLSPPPGWAEEETRISGNDVGMRPRDHTDSEYEVLAVRRAGGGAGGGGSAHLAGGDEL
mmetsp:Transcript_12416/g.33773  ORF Transcript_12416/g.33773 Transcript_12416/m.33773 type:complete len:212 (-) Transcript_12416:135-770(-)